MLKHSKTNLMFISIILMWGELYSQKIYYDDLRDSVMTLTCGPSIYSSDVYGSMRRLEALDTNRIGKNIHMYYEDMGICYWMASSKAGTDYLQKSVDVNRKALHHKPKSTRAMWDLVCSYARLDDCEHAKYYLELYAKHTPKKYLDESHDREVLQIMAMCHFD